MYVLKHTDETKMMKPKLRPLSAAVELTGITLEI